LKLWHAILIDLGCLLCVIFNGVRPLRSGVYGASGAGDEAEKKRLSADLSVGESQIPSKKGAELA